MDTTDRNLINRLQDEIPLVERPFAAIGEALGLSEGEVLARTQALAAAGTFRRLGASFDARQLGYVTTLVAVRVAADRIEAVAGFLRHFPDVTHNYEREHEFNLWFTLVSRNQARVEAILGELHQQFPEAEILNLPATRSLKTRVFFDMTRP